MRYSVFFTDHHPLPLPPGHRFPETKYRLLRELLLAENILSPEQLRAAGPASFEELCLAHSPDYVRAVQAGTVDPQEFKRVGLPWSPGLFERTAATVGGALHSAQSALRTGIAGCLAGGTHHAHFDRGEGYCVFNDLAVATRWLQRENLAQRIAIVDLDVHQGNGNSSILGGDENVFIASIHGEKNYPFKKIPSTIDFALPDGAGDELYLETLEQLLTALGKFSPDFIFYQMGVDPLKEDKLGKMSLSFAGLMARDRLLLRFARARKIPISLALGGGYAEPIDLSVRAYANTYIVANEIFG